MKKTFIGIVALSFIAFAMPQAQAVSDPTIVIIDSGIDKTVSGLSDSIVQEACFAVTGCKTFEGTGSATVPGTKHGTTMALVAKKIYPNAKIVMIRVFQADSTADMVSMTTTEATSTLNNAFDWIIKNKDKYNIVSISASMGGGLYTNATCPSTVQVKTLASKIDTLASIGIPTMFASGNDSSNKANLGKINFPACIAQSVSVGGTVADNSIMTESNTSSEVDFFALGVYNILGKGVRGTSASTAAFSAYWAKNYKGSYKATYDYLKSVSKPTKNAYASASSFVDVLK